MIDEESVTGRASYPCFQITVENRDYHHLSQNETLSDIGRSLCGNHVLLIHHKLGVGECVTPGFRTDYFAGISARIAIDHETPPAVGADRRDLTLFYLDFANPYTSD
jgi:hypothetical protein